MAGYSAASYCVTTTNQASPPGSFHLLDSTVTSMQEGRGLAGQELQAAEQQPGDVLLPGGHASLEIARDPSKEEEQQQRQQQQVRYHVKNSRADSGIRRGGP